MGVNVPIELLTQAIAELNKAKLMMNGGMYTLQDMPMPTALKRELVINSSKVSVIAGKLFAYTLKEEMINDEIKEVESMEEAVLINSLRYFDKKHS